MRYLIKAITAHESEQAQAAVLVESGEMEAPEQFEGYVQGIGDEHLVAKIAATGLTVSVTPLPDPPAAALGLTTFSARAGADFAVTAMPDVFRADGQAEYFLIQMSGGLSPARKQALAAAQINVVERDHGDWYVAKLPSRASVDGLDFVSEVRLFDAAETLAPVGYSLPDLGVVDAQSRSVGGQVYEATLHSDASADAVAADLTAAGATIIGRSSEVLRFLPNAMPLVDIADIPQIAQLQAVTSPRLFDDNARTLLGVDRGEHGLERVLDLDGDGEIVGVADTGIDAGHPDFAGRVMAVTALGRPGDASDPNGHGTHVAGSILGDGSQSGGKLAGVAPKAQLYFQSLLDVNGRLGGLPSDMKLLFQPAYDAGVRVHNNSWGAFLHSRYGAASLQLDAFVHTHPDFLAIVAAGNDGSCLPGRMAGKPGHVDYPSVASPASAKNCLTVGASRNSRATGGYAAMSWGAAWKKAFPADPIGSETISGESEGIAGFSARGPVDDQRVKPDVVAPGTDIASTRSSQAPMRNFWGAYPGSASYAFMGGTSMAAPLVAGCAALVRQYYRRDRRHVPSAALMKATIINGTIALSHWDAVADPVGFPNYHQGFGRVDLRRTLPNADAPDLRLEFVDSPRTTTRIFTALGQRFRWRIDLDAEAALSLCLVWTDPPARGLQNTLMAVLDNGGLGTKWVSNEQVASLLKLDTPLEWSGLPIHFDRDANNNVHVIRVVKVPPGSYTLTLIADLLTTETQSFALVVTGAIAAMGELN